MYMILCTHIQNPKIQIKIRVKEEFEKQPFFSLSPELDLYLKVVQWTLSFGFMHGSEI